MPRPLYRPTLRQTACLAVLALAGLGYGFFMRYQVIEQSSIGIACETSGNWLCANRRTVITLFTPQAFGILALCAAALNVLRPSVVLWSVALLAGCAGIVLYNTELSALAMALLIVSLARPAPEIS
jgi:hypothetical protein